MQVLFQNGGVGLPNRSGSCRTFLAVPAPPWLDRPGTSAGLDAFWHVYRLAFGQDAEARQADALRPGRGASHDEHPLGAGGRVVAGPAVDMALGKAGVSQ